MAMAANNGSICIGPSISDGPGPGTYIAGIQVAGAGNPVGITASDQLFDTTISSRRFKTDIEDLKVAEDVVELLRPVSFKWNDQSATPGVADIGLIAEEVAVVSQDLTIYEEEEDQQTPKGVRYDKLAIVLLKHVQIQQQTIDALRAENSDMKADLEAIKQHLGL
jgi:hypothetical protein